MEIIEPSVGKHVISRLVQIQEEIAELIDELEILSDEEVMKDIAESKKDFEEGRYYTLKTDEEIEQFFSDLVKE
ncbi:MAG: hypothetical protein C5S38_09795 [Candidatus Methanophagaceae archaeon]|jgi:hypothetical protein|nr:MAG: hypothetical protein C5S38_09795 [Methanophagales archaeon]